MANEYPYALVEQPGPLNYVFSPARRPGYNKASLVSFMSTGYNMPLAYQDLIERLRFIQDAGRTPKRIYLRRDVWEHANNALPNYRIQPYRQWIPNKGAFLFGVPVSFSKSKRVPFSILDDRGDVI